VTVPAGFVCSAEKGSLLYNRAGFFGSSGTLQLLSASLRRRWFLSSTPRRLTGGCLAVAWHLSGICLAFVWQ
jgi:hypothetical protein